MAKKNIFSELIKTENTKQPLETSPILTILPTLESYIPPLTVEERRLLEQSLLNEGCREALVVWQQPEGMILVDGHNRYSICKQHNLPFKVQAKNFENLDKVKNWMIANQLGKRNITEEVKSYLRGLQYKLEKAQHGGERKASGQTDHLKTRDKIALQNKVSPKTIQRDEQFYQGLELLTQNNEELKWKILQRQIIVPKNLIAELPKQTPEKTQALLTTLEQNTLPTIKKNKLKTAQTPEKLLAIFLKQPTEKNLEELVKILKQIMNNIHN